MASGLLASATSALAAAVCSRVEHRHAARPMNAIAHIWDGGPPPRRDGPRHRNTLTGLAIHTAASLWWALIYEALPQKLRTRASAVALASVACLVDYGVVGRRLRPGFERHLGAASLAAIYGAFAAGFMVAGALQRRLDHHQEEDRHEGDERRPAERRPDAVVAPEERR